MRRRGLLVLAALAAIAVTALGLTGAFAYGSNYSVTRGFTPIAPLKGAGTGRELTEHFYSPAMHKEVYYLVYLPPGYSPRRHYPVYYLLHGEPGRPRVFIQVASMNVRMDNLITEHASRPMILVYPNGQIDDDYYSDSEWANTPSGQFESYVIEVMHQVDDHFSAIRSRDARVLGGFSMGAYGAMNIGLHHLDDFADIQAWSGYYIETHNGVFAHASAPTMAYNSPGEYVRHLRREIHRYPLRAFMYVGDRDPDAPQQAPMARALREAGAHVGARIHPGGHDWSLWWGQAYAMIRQASADTLHPPAPTRLPRGRITPVPARFGAIVSHHHRRSTGARHPHHRRLAVLGGRRILRRLTVTDRVDGRTVVRHLVVVGPALRRSPHPTLRLIGALLLALVAAALINLGFVLQHRGHAEAVRRGAGGLRGAVRTPLWLGGQLVGWIGWAGQIVAVALVPLTLVQAVGAGSLALSVPLAAWLFGYRITRGQAIAIAVIAVCLASLPVGAATRGHLDDGLLVGIALGLGAVGALACRIRATAVRAAIAGILYGLADAAIKADAISLHRFGPAGLIGGWTVVAALATLGGFLAFQAALRGHDAVAPLSLMAALSAVTGVVIGVSAFGEPLGRNLLSGAVHAAAIVLVLVCVPPLVMAQQRLAGSVQEDPRPDGAGVPGPVTPVRRTVRPARLVRALGGGVGALVAAIVWTVAGVGLLYSLRGLHVLGVGPSIHDALPLLQLAGFSSQPLVRVVAAFLPTGLALGLALSRLSPGSRLLMVAPVAALLLLSVSDASYALSNNVAFLPVLLHREPGFGPWLQWLLIVGGAGLPGLRAAAMHSRTPRPSANPPMRPLPA